jgi:hypothetical protein
MAALWISHDAGLGNTRDGKEDEEEKKEGGSPPWPCVDGSRPSCCLGFAMRIKEMRIKEMRERKKGV